MTSIKLKTPVTGEYEQPTGLYVDLSGDTLSAAAMLIFLQLHQQ